MNKAKYCLRLFISGTSPHSVLAVNNVKRICDKHLPGRYDLEIVDLYQQPQLAADEQIIAAPTLVKKEPYPLKKLVGDMSDTKSVLLGLDLNAEN